MLPHGPDEASDRTWRYSAKTLLSTLSDSIVSRPPEAVHRRFAAWSNAPQRFPGENRIDRVSIPSLRYGRLLLACPA